MNDEPPLPTAAQYRERSERARVEARSRYRGHLVTLFTQQGVDGADALAGLTLDAFTEWRSVETGDRCRCSCHPQLPDSDRHDYGFDCVCTHTGERRRAAVQQWLTDMDAYWESPEGQRTRTAERAAEAELDVWLSRHPGVVMHSHGGWAPEQWTGEIDGHGFYFRERHDDWHVEIDLRPTGGFINAVEGPDVDGTTRHRRREFEQGDVVATGTIYSEGYGTTLVERAQFIVTTIRDHLTRNACTHHLDKLDSIADILGTFAVWCPACGTRLGATTTDVGDGVGQ